MQDDERLLDASDLPEIEASADAGRKPASLLFLKRFLSPFRHLFGRVESGVQRLLSISTLFLILELLIAFHWHLPPLPFAICGAGLLVVVCYALSRRGEQALTVARAISVVSLMKTLAVFVGVTGGVLSPFLGVLYLPIFLSCLHYGVKGGTAAGAAVCLFLWQLTLWTPDAMFALGEPLLTQCVVFSIVSIGAALFAERMRRTTFAANRRANAHADRARQVEWFSDTEIMMQALDDMQIMLSVALMRVADLVPCDSAAIYLREPDDKYLRLAETHGIASRRVALQSIPLHRLDVMRAPEFSALTIPDTDVPSDPLFFLFSPFDPAAGSMVITPLKTLDDLFGVMCVASHRPKAFSEHNIRSLTQLSRHVVFPIQRVRLEAMASTDGLTGLNNSRVFRRRLSDEVDRAIRYNHNVSLIMIDIDHFKRVNDTLGHRAGDTILTQIGAILRRSSRTIDVTARYGGEEMAILCPEATDTDAAQLAERVRSVVEESRFELPGGETTRITISCGVAMLRSDRRTESELIEAADKALYRAKAGGRNRVCLASQTEGARKPGK